MCSWKGYIDNLMADGSCQDAAIVGYIDSNKSVWASHCGGTFATITPGEIDQLITKDQDSLYINGLTLGGKKCSIIRNRLFVDGEWTADIRTKCPDGGPTYNISVGKACQALIIVIGKEGVHGGQLNKKAFEMVEYLRKCGY